MASSAEAPVRTDPIERLIRRDRPIILTALVLVTALAWLYVIRLAGDMDMGAMDMRGMRMISTGLHMVMAPAILPWTPAVFLWMCAMWTVMMIGMMTPSAAPLILLYARVGRSAASTGSPFAATIWFALGYLSAWALFSLAATTAQWALDRAALLTPGLAVVSARAGGIVLLLAGLYQWSPLKEACLTQCQSPLTFLQRHGGFRRRAFGAWRLGLHHGLYCVGCCWVLMALLFAGGVMNLLWIAVLSVLVLLEKIVPVGRAVSRLAGAGLVAGAGWMLLR